MTTIRVGPRNETYRGKNFTTKLLNQLSVVGHSKKMFNERVASISNVCKYLYNMELDIGDPYVSPRIQNMSVEEAVFHNVLALGETGPILDTVPC